MRSLPLLVIAVLATGCAKTDDEAALPADTAHIAPAPAGLTAADVSGTWRVNVMPADKDSVLNSYTMWATEDLNGWKMLFDGRTDTIAISGVTLAGDSITTRFGPYSSALRPNVQVVTETVGRLQNGKMVGTVLAHYAVTTPDSVLNLRFEGTRQ
jgi:hypothetical protein